MYKVKYAGFSIQGLVRQRNEDNLYVDGQYLPITHTDTESLVGEIKNTDKASFAVLDGMGGEQCGDLAAYVAVKKYAESDHKPWNSGTCCRQMNQAVLEAAKEQKVKTMGTAIVSVRFDRKKIRGFNLGDCRCYVFSKQKLEQLSQDHVLGGHGIFGGGLTQFLGIPEKEYIVSPYSFDKEYRDGTILLMCTDGVYSILGDTEIEKILNKEQYLQKYCDSIKEKILKKGAPDNASLLLFQVEKIAWKDRMKKLISRRED